MVQLFARRVLTLLVATAAFVAVNPARADESSSLVLRGYVPISCNIDVAATQVASNIPLGGAQSDLAVARVTETCNNRNGYTVSVASESNGALTGRAGRIAYELKYGDAVAPLERSAGQPVVVAQSAVRTSERGVSRDVRISHAGAQAGGAYGDTLTFTIAAK